MKKGWTLQLVFWVNIYFQVQLKKWHWGSDLELAGDVEVLSYDKLFHFSHFRVMQSLYVLMF